MSGFETSAEIDALRRAIAVQEAERTRISRELHDESGQVLAALTLRVRALEPFISDPRGLTSLADLRDEIAAAARRVHSVARDLRPAAIAQTGLVLALQRQAERLEHQHSVRVELAIDDLPVDLGQATEEAVFRVVQEAVMNVARHSGVAFVSVVVVGQPGNVRIMIEDNGRGFDPDAATHGLGLCEMRERVALLGGRVRLESSRGTGTVLVVDLPTEPAR